MRTQIKKFWSLLAIIIIASCGITDRQIREINDWHVPEYYDWRTQALTLRYCVYTDNLPQVFNVGVLDSVYYNTLSSRDFKRIHRYVDVEKWRQEIHLFSPRARNGYLFVNKRLKDLYPDISCDIQTPLFRGMVHNYPLDCDTTVVMNVVYVLDDQPIATKRDVKRLLGLKKQRIKYTDIIIDDKTKTITVYIQTAKPRFF